MAGFLTRADVRRLTGTGDKQAQLAWLAKEGISHRVNGAGQIVVTWAAVDAPRVTMNWRPDFSALKA